jgi:hypothetical protein
LTQFGIRVTVGWGFLVCSIVICHGFKIYGFELPTSVLLALVTTTTFNVLGLLIIVMKFVFNPEISKLKSPRDNVAKAKPALNTK